MPASFSLSVLISLLAALAGYVFLAVQQNSPRDDYAPLTLPGPVVLGAVDGVKLDGLTLVRTVRLPAIKIKLPGIGTLKIKNQTSELVFDKLRVTDVRVRAADAASGALHTSAKASLDFKGTVLATTEFVSFSNHPYHASAAKVVLSGLRLELAGSREEDLQKDDVRKTFRGN